MSKIVSPKVLSSLLILLIVALRLPVFAQTGQAPAGPEKNAIQTAVPFLTITPDARAGGMGDVGAAGEPDVNSQYWNVARFPIWEINKILVPTQPIWLTTPAGAPVLNPQGNQIVQYGKDPYVSTPVGMLQSFWDAPGVLKDDGTRSRFQEEINEMPLVSDLNTGTMEP